MQKPNSYDEVQAGGDFIPIATGGHYAVIKKVTETTSSTNKPMIIVSIDFDKKDSQPGYFVEQFKKDIRPEKKYPYQAVQYILTNDADGKCARNFKSFIKAFEDSNKCTCAWGENFEEQFKNKKIGVVYGEVEEEYNGEVKMRRRIRWFCDYAKVPDQKVPEAKLLSNKPAASQKNSDFVNVPADIDDEIPFE